MIGNNNLGSIISFAFIVYLCWRYTFHNKAISHLRFGLKIMHGLFMIFAGFICWIWMFLSFSLMSHPLIWIGWVSKTAVWPTWVDFLFQSGEIVVGPLVVVSYYFMLKGVDRARRSLLYLLPFIYVCFCYDGVAAGYRANRQASIELICILVAVFSIVPFAALLVFYTRTSVIVALFSCKKL
jgi:hypothetical protein